MTNEEYEFTLQDRIAKIKAINEQFDLEKNGFQAFSGGLDSCVTSRLLDVALPNNTIPRVFVNTGVEHKFMRKFVEREGQENYNNKFWCQFAKDVKKRWLPFQSKSICS